jgi:hypothetical protein
MTPMDSAELDKRFTSHPPQGDQSERYAQIRSEIRRVAELITDLTPDSREQALALTKLEEAVFWANAAIARRSGS